jgi:uracil-DNA glycosylase
MLSKQNYLDILKSEVSKCQACRLSENRTHTVFGEGNQDAKVVLVGESPGATEDETGRPFVGRAGKLLDNMIMSIGLARDDVYITNICCCRPPGNRKPHQDEMDACKARLHKQLSIIQPEIIIALGNTALGGLTGQDGGIVKRCGEWEEIDIDGRKIRLLPIFHPSALLRNPNWKAPAWHALQKVGEAL